jgi:hypothetical protein
MTFRTFKQAALVAAIAAPMALAATQASAITVTADTNTTNLLNALLGGGTGLTVTSVTLSGHTDGGAVSSGTYTNGSGTYGIGSGIILSSGNVTDYGDGANGSSGNTTNFGGVNASPASAGQEALLDPITGGGLDHYDVTQLDLTFDVAGDVSNIFFNVVFGSDEYAEFVGSSFIDAFGIYLNGTNIATFAGDPVNIDHPNMAFIGGTELDGILDPTSGSGDPIMLFQGLVTPGSTGNTLTFIIADSGDSQLDSTVYIEGLGTENPGGGTPGGGTQVPEPGAMTVFGLGLLGLAWARRRKSV